MHDARFQLAVSSWTNLVAESKAFGCQPPFFDEFRVVCLGKVEQPRVAPKVVDEEFRVSVEAEAGDDYPVEVLDQVVGQVKGPDFSLLDLIERARTCEELVAVGTREAVDSEFRTDGIKAVSSSAVGISDEHVVVMVAGRLDPAFDCSRDQFRCVV